jgi:hypothetical protein
MSRFDDFADAVIAQSRALARTELQGFEDHAQQDARAFLARAEADLKRWTAQLARGELSKQDFTDLVQAKKALAEIHALTEAGIGAARLERFRSGLLALVLDNAFKVFV